MQKALLLLAQVVLLLCLFSCTSGDSKVGDFIDPGLSMSRSEYQKKLLPEKPPVSEEEPPIPEFSEVIATPSYPEVGSDKYVTLSVTESTPLKDVLIELSREGDVDMEIDPNISGGIILSVRDKPFNEVIRRVAVLGGLRYQSEEGILRVERDLPFFRSYHLDFLNLIRSNTGSISTNTQVLGSSSGEDGDGGLSSGSTTAITSNYDGDLWNSINTTVEGILSYHEGLSISGDAAKVSSESNYSVNRQAGVLSVFATGRQHASLEDYLLSVKRSVASQVLIEAKVVEVSLNKEFRTGIDWGSLNQRFNFDVVFNGFETAATDFVSVTGAAYNLGIDFIRALETFGTTRTLSSPRLHAMNNQQAVLTFAENDVYFRLAIEEEEESNGVGVEPDRTLTVESTVNTVPIGVVLSLQPSIDLEKQEVTMNIRPTISRVVRREADPAVAIIAARIATDNAGQLSSTVPVIKVRELDTVLKIKSGDVMVMGGLMEERVTNEDNGVPFVSRVPVLGNAFKSVTKTKEIVETIILIKATIMPTEGSVHERDKQVYRDFVNDPRPITF